MPYILIEGGEGTGKTTQMRLLAESLKNAGLPTLMTHEPGGTDVGAKIRYLLLHEEVAMTALTELFLFSADRAELMQSVIRPALDAGQVVLSDRSFPSTIVYQGYAGNTPIEDIERCTEVAMTGVTPALIAVIDLDVDTAFRRKSEDQLDRIEEKGRGYHESVYDGYRRFVERYQPMAQLVSGYGSPEDVHHLLIDLVNDRLGFSLEYVR